MVTSLDTAVCCKLDDDKLNQQRLRQASNNYDGNSRLKNFYLQAVNARNITVSQTCHPTDCRADVDRVQLTSRFSLQILHSHIDCFWRLNVSMPHLLQTACTTQTIVQYTTVQATELLD